jgi:hypothetical protein
MVAGFVFWFAATGTCLVPHGARAAEPAGEQQKPAGEQDKPAPSAFSCALDGLWLGLLVGSSGGYLRARRGGFEKDDWKPVVLGGGIGALSGIAVGLGACLGDLAAERPGRASIAVRDTLYGAGIGALLGAITGALVMIRSEDWESIGFGSAIGTISGAGAGLIVGVIEGHLAAKRAARGAARAPPLPALAWTRDSGGVLLPALTLRGRF